MITNITLENFKCFRQVSINPKLLTVLIGPNGTGKSSILQALLLLKQSVGEERIRHQGKFVNFPDSSTAVPNYLPSISTFRLTFAGTSHEILSSSEEILYFRYGVEISSCGSMRDSFGEMSSRVGEDAIEVCKEKGAEVTPRSFNSGNFRIDLHEGSTIGSLVRFITESPNIPHVSGESAAQGSVFSGRVMRMVNAPRATLEGLSCVPSVRGLVRPRYHLGDELLDEVSLEYGLSGQEEQTASNIGYSRSLEERLSYLMKEVTGTGLRAEPVPPQAVEINAITPSGTTNIVSEGFGTNALILLLHQLITAKRGATVLIEEPEIHLHPKAQAELAEVMAETAKAEDKQIIMTTHSEHLLSRLLTLVAEGKLTTDDLAIYYFEKDEKGECSATEIKVTERGQTEGGLTGFFDNNLAEMDRYVKALQGRS